MNNGETKKNPIQEKSYAFALRVVKICHNLTISKKEYVLSRQFLRSGTSVGANIEEALGAQSKKEFAAKMSIAHKEARETHYWLRLLMDSNTLDGAEAKSLIVDCKEVLRIVGAIQRTVRANLIEQH